MTSVNFAHRSWVAKFNEWPIIVFMDWKIMFSTFVAVFIAELGDKTQLATFSLAGGSDSRASVLAGAILALSATSILAVLAGGVIGQMVPAIYIKRTAGLIFIILGAVYLVGK